MTLKSAFGRACSVLVSAVLLLGLNSCGTVQSDSAVDGSELPASSIIEEPLSVTHPFIYSDVTWSTSVSELEAITNKKATSTSYAGNGKKRYFFDDVECDALVGHCSYTYVDDFLCESAFTADSSQSLNDVSDYFVATLTKTYDDPTTDKSELSSDGTGIWLIWENDDVDISYFYVKHPDTKKYEITLTYALPDSTLPVIDPSDRNGDFRVGFWGDNIDTINKYETAKFEGVSEDEDGTVMMYSGTVAGKDAYIIYNFDIEGKLYCCFYGINNTYSSSALYITAYESLKDSLSEKYGKPSSDDVKKISSLANYADPDIALQLGYSVYRTIWNTDTTEISLGMLNSGDGISTMIAYTDPHHEKTKNTSGL